MLTEKNATIGPSDASTDTRTASVAASSRTTEINDSREPTSALNTYSDGNVTAKVSTNSAGTFTTDASNW